MKKTYLIILLFFLFILIFSSRLVKLTNSPPGYYIDESAMIYNAYSILKTSRDEHGFTFPLFFQSFGDWKEPIFVYSQIPFLILFGPTIQATRLTSAFWGLITIFLFSYFIYSYSGKKYLALSSIIFITFMPWHFHFSRIGFQLITLPFFVIVYLIFILKFTQTNLLKYFYLSSFTLALFFYTYYSGRFYSFFFFLIQIIFFFLHRKITFKNIVISSIFFLIPLIPAFIWNYYYPETFFSRYQAVTILSQNLSLSQNITNYLKAYFSHFSYSLFFGGGDKNLRHSTGFSYPLLTSTLPLLLLGLFNLFKNFKKTFSQLILIFLLTFPAASAITTNPPHIHRIIHILPIVTFLITLGFYQLIFLLEKVRLKKIPQKYLYVLFSSIFFVIFFCQWQQFFQNYFTSYKEKAKVWFHYYDLEATQDLLNYPGSHYLSNQLFDYQPTSFYLLNLSYKSLPQVKNLKSNFLNLTQSSQSKPGTYLLKDQDCYEFSIKNPHARLLKFTPQKYCYFQIE